MERPHTRLALVDAGSRLNAAVSAVMPAGRSVADKRAALTTAWQPIHPAQASPVPPRAAEDDRRRHARFQHIRICLGALPLRPPRRVVGQPSARGGKLFKTTRYII